MEIGHWDQLDDISLDWLIGAWLRDMTLGRTNPDTSPAMVFLLLQGDHVNNHLLIRVPSLTMDTQTPCQVKAIPCKSEGIEPFTWSTLHQVKLGQWHRTRSTLCRVKSGSPPENQKVLSPSPWSLSARSSWGCSLVPCYE